MYRLSQFFANFFGGLVDLFVKKYGVEVGRSLALWAAYLATWALFYAALKALVGGVAGVFSNQWLLMGFWAVWPANAETCVAAILAGDVAAWLYRVRLRSLRLSFGGNDPFR